ncbi:MAG: hypothetical protein WDO72_05045 [Pseudomonadota bacterium]
MRRRAAPANGLPLSDVFRTVNEETRSAADNPGEQALATGKVIEVSLHTALIARDGREAGIETCAASSAGCAPTKNG